MTAMADIHIPPTDHFESDLGDFGSDTENQTSDSPMELLDILGAADDTRLTKDRIRCTAIDGVMKISVYDVMQYVCNVKNTRQAWSDLKQNWPEVVRITDNFKFPGAGQRDTPVTDSKGLLKILMHIPGRRSGTIREKVADIANRFYAGDLSLCADIREINHKLAALEESDPTNLALAFRSSAKAHEEELSPEERESRKRKRKHEDELEELGLLDKKMALLNKILAPIANDVDRIWMADYSRNQTRLILDTAPVLPGPGVEGADTSLLTVNVADEAKAMGVEHRGSILKKYGRAAVKAYRQKYGEDPPKREQLVNGRPCAVFHYFDGDRQLVRDAISRVFEQNI